MITKETIAAMLKNMGISPLATVLTDISDRIDKLEAASRVDKVVVPPASLIHDQHNPVKKPQHASARSS